MTIKCEETTKKYNRLPPPQAVPFTGFHFAKIKSREPVAERLKDFTRRTKEADFFTTALIIAEWGEGKTDAFERYIKPECDRKGDYAYLVSTSTIVNKLSRADDLFPYGPPESVTLAACILHALRDELDLRNEDLSRFPDYREYKDPLEYVDAVLTKHLNNGGQVVYLFIDEFEEILAQDSKVQKKFMSGLKELLNGQLKIVHEHGKFAGRLHFILACTPYAYNRIRGDVDLAQIFGALDQRLSSNRINMPQIGKKEAMGFLIDILRFCYEHSLPQPLPIKSSGILNGIFSVSQRNMRSLVQLLSDLLSTATLNGESCVIDHEHFLNTLKGKPISVYGASTQCVDEELLLKIESALGNLTYGKDYLRIFRLLAGELKPFSTEEVQNRTGVKAVPFRVNEINQELKKKGVSNSITRLNPLKEDKTIEDVLKSLNPVENAIPLGTERKISIENFKDETIQYELDSAGSLHPAMFIPTEQAELEKALDLHQEEAEYLYRSMSKHFSNIAATRHFMLSKELIDQIFPSPLVLQLDFIVDRSQRMDLWRKAMKGFLERDLELRDGLIEVINLESSFEIATSSHKFNLIYTLPSGIPVTLSLAIHSATGRVTMNDAENLRELVKRERPDLVLLFHVGEIEEKALRELGATPNILSIHIRPIRAQQLIALSLARKDRVEINESILAGRLQETLYEIDFGQKFNKWLERCRKEGLLVEDLKRPSGRSERTLAQAMTYYVQSIEDKSTLQKVFEQSKKLQDFTLYGRGKKPSFAPLDVETAESLNEYQKELCRNGFLQGDENEIQIIATPIEMRIHNYLKDGKLSIEEMERRFLNFAQNERLLEQVYFPILEAKGSIQVTKDDLIQVNRERREKRIRQKMKNYLERIKNKGQEWRTYAHICISKEREDRIIMLNEFDEYLRELFDQLDSPQVKYNEELCLRALHLLDVLLAYSDETLQLMITEAWMRGRGIVKNVKSQEDEAQGALNSILQFYNNFSEKKYEETDIEEYVKLKTAFDKVLETGKAEYDRSEIESDMELISSIFEPRRRFEGVPRYFYFKRDSEKASYFNYKVHEMEGAERAFSTIHEGVSNAIREVIRAKEKLRGLGSESRSRLLKYSINEQYTISSAFHKALLSYQSKPIKPIALKTLSIRNIIDFLEKMHDTQREFNFKINESLKILESLINREKTLLAAGEETANLAERLVSFFEEGGELLTAAAAVNSDVGEYMKTYADRAIEFQRSMEQKAEIDDINETASKTDDKLFNWTNLLEQGQKRLSDLCEKSTAILRKHQDNILKFLDILQEGGVDVIRLSTPFKEVIGQAIKDIEGLSNGEKSEYTWKQVLDNLEGLKLKLFGEVKNILQEDQFNVLLAIVEASATQEWLDLLALRKNLTGQFEMSEDQIDETIKALIQRKMLKEGISLPI